jgi:integrase
VAFAVVATAAFTGLRLAELRGLQWRDFTGEKLSVGRTMWRTKEGLPKTESSEKYSSRSPHTPFDAGKTITTT